MSINHFSELHNIHRVVIVLKQQRHKVMTRAKCIGVIECAAKLKKKKWDAIFSRQSCDSKKWKALNIALDFHRK